MKLIKILFLIAVSFTLASTLEVEDLIWPKPQFIQKGNQTFSFSKNCKLQYKFKNGNFPNSHILDQMLKLYMNRYMNTDKPRSFYGCTKYIHLDIINHVYVSPFPTTSTNAKDLEYYKILISPEEITITVNFINGVVRGLETLSQLFSHKNQDEENYSFFSTPLLIEDYPIYPIRGIMIDTSRHFIKIDKIKEILDGMLHSKLNTLHWHIVDDDNFSFESKIIPFISKGQEVYTQSQIRDLMHYANVRGIQIVPEFDSPGHVRSWGLNKELSNITLINVNDTQYGYFDPSENFTYNVTLDILSEAMKVFSTQEKSALNVSNLFHLGGDEVNYNVWTENKKISNFMKEKGLKDNYDLFNYYLNRVRKSLPTNKNYIYWIDSDFFKNNRYKQIDIFRMENSILHYWGSTNDILNHLISNNTTNGTKYNMILSPYDFTYLDCGTGNIYGDRSWCDPYVTWKKTYRFNPDDYNKGDLNVVGSIACLWSELVDDSNVIGKIFPRASALAERLWTKSTGEVDIKSAFKRLVIFNNRLIERKINTQRITNKYCETHLEECSKFVN